MIVLALLQFLPILFYELTGKKKEQITAELMSRREKSGALAGVE